MLLIVKITRWVRSSLIGHVVFYGLLWAIVMSSVFNWLNYSEGAVTLSWALFSVLVCAVVGAIIGALGWWGITQPMQRRRQMRETIDQQHRPTHTQ